MPGAAGGRYLYGRWLAYFDGFYNYALSVHMFVIISNLRPYTVVD